MVGLWGDGHIYSLQVLEVCVDALSPLLTNVEQSVSVLWGWRNIDGWMTFTQT